MDCQEEKRIIQDFNVRRRELKILYLTGFIEKMGSMRQSCQES
jgi:hypothetical protein